MVSGNQLLFWIQSICSLKSDDATDSAMDVKSILTFAKFRSSICIFFSDEVNLLPSGWVSSRVSVYINTWTTRFSTSSTFENIFCVSRGRILHVTSSKAFLCLMDEYCSCGLNTGHAGILPIILITSHLLIG